jgi:hypothetical protein
MVRLFSAPGRVHARDITKNGFVSGSIAAPQKLSTPVLGATFEAKARIVPNGEYRKAIFTDWLERKLFKEEELAKYLEPNSQTAHSGVPPHEVYEGVVYE